MAKSLALKLRHKKYNRSTLVIYSAILILIFHAYLVSYINSSYIGKFVGSQGVGIMFTVASALTILIFLFISRVLHKVGNYQTTLGLLVINFAAVLGMALTDSLRFSLPLFITHITVLPLIIFNLDVFLEENIGNKEGTTGSKRGLLLATSSLVAALTPILTGYLVGEEVHFAYAYFVSAMAVIPAFLIILVSFKNFQDPKYKEIEVFKAIRSFWIKHDIRFVFSAHFLLQVFFFFMVVYTPLYLATEINMDWRSIGLVLFGAQLAYVFFEYPIGTIADKYIGEKEMMIAGFFILSLSTAALAFVTTASVWTWVILMFITRTGASLAEVTTESYFFKHTRSSDAQIISFFRITRPLSYVIGSLVGSLAILYLPFSYMFIVLALIMLPGALFAQMITDTK